ncbi:properdin [Sander lucioperca]|uniref:Properdin n=1 Tax=Sander lucioperca TaxID=283035 RepID=A0A8C9YNH6_SANLU|nr:properdin [Sander lucioperca]
MEVLVLGLLVLLLVSVERSECVRCFARFDLNLGQCDEELGELDEDDCCQNTQYGYQGPDGVCRGCGPPAWSPWSPWSQCNVLVGEGVTQRRRTCFGIGDCEKSEKLETKPCTGTCYNVKGWGPWLPWSPCSVSCGEGGERKRERVCSSPPECLSACTGPSEETEKCPTQTTCPVHGGWSGWSSWAACSAVCISTKDGDDVIPSRLRSRDCSSPAPSSDTVPPGDGCPGDRFQTQECSDLPNCPVDGSWGAWSQPGPCSVSCGEGLQLATRRCDSPAPKYGGRHCDGPSTQSSVCQSPCPVDGFWTGWSSWGECSASCIPEGRAPVRSRQRSCSNPAPSSSPPGAGCQGGASETTFCNHLPHCSVDGGWGSWSPFSSCPVTCGAGLQVSLRRCDSPAPKHGGQPCPGEGRRTSICQTNQHCPVDGMWSQWSPWNPCKYPFGGRDIRCKQIGGRQARERQCLHRAHNGSICSGGALTETRVCYDVDKCYPRGTWEGWEPWSLCRPSCGGSPRRFRIRRCTPDFSDYSPTIGRLKEPATFFGDPKADCGTPPNGEPKIETQNCVNVPACT